MSCAAGGIRTLKPLRAAGFEPALYASSSTAAGGAFLTLPIERNCPGLLAGNRLAMSRLLTETGSYTSAVNRNLLERRLSELSSQLRELRRELVLVDEQFTSLADEADDARLRSLVSETPLAEREHREASRHAEAMGRHRSEVVGDIARLEQQQDDLLDRLNELSE